MALQQESPPALHVLLLGLQARHLLLMHSPLQQSASPLHVALPARQAQTPPAQSPTQQSEVTPHALPSLAQLHVDETWKKGMMGQVP
jgi:hypothetical protein